MLLARSCEANVALDCGETARAWGEAEGGGRESGPAASSQAEKSCLL